MEKLKNIYDGIDGFFWEPIDNIPDGLLSAFLLSAMLLLIISILKYALNHKCEKKDWGNLVLEYPIDVCSIIVTIIFSSFIVKDNHTAIYILVAISCLVSVICCLLRRSSINSSYSDKLGCCIVYAFLDILLASMWIFYFLYHIS